MRGEGNFLLRVKENEENEEGILAAILQKEVIRVLKEEGG